MQSLETLKKFSVTIAAYLGRWEKSQIVICALGAVLLLGYADYLMGAEISLGVFYAIPVGAVTWFVGPRSALVVGLVAIASWLSADKLAGQHYSHPWIPLLNGAARFVFYAFMVATLAKLRHLQHNLVGLAETRARDLAREAARNVWLEREVLEIGEREQRRIGQDLHDGLCQHLTGTALASQVLAEKLPEGAPVRADARRLAELIEDGIALARGVAKGLYPVELQSDGLMQALENFTASTSEMFGIQCHFECPSPVLIENPSTAAHLYRIAQEAVSNALRHGHATRIEVVLEESDSEIRLRVSDNGAGLPDPLPTHDGMGLRTMTDRAGSIGGQLSILPGVMGGAEVVCMAPGRWMA
jgi:signal transduction histidine kinase